MCRVVALLAIVVGGLSGYDEVLLGCSNWDRGREVFHSVGEIVALE